MALPFGGRKLVGLPAACLVRAGRGRPASRLPATEPLGVVEGHADGDGEFARSTGARVGGTPERSCPRIRVLVELRGASTPFDSRPRGPPPAHVLPLDGAERIRG